MKAIKFLLLGLCLALCACAKPERKIAVQTWSLNAYTLEESLNILKPLGVKAIEVYQQPISKKYPKVRFGHNMNDEQRAFVKKLLKDADIKVIATGVWGGNGSDQDIEQICAFAKEFEIPTIVTEAKKDKLDIWSKMCKKYGVRMCIHNHQRGTSMNNNYYDPKVVMELIKGYDNIGACPDNGAWSRSGIDSVEGFKTMKGKIYEVHLKDQKEFNNLRSPAAAYGKGVLDMKAILAELDAQGFDGYLVIEHGDDQKTIVDILKTDLEFLRNN